MKYDIEHNGIKLGSIGVTAKDNQRIRSSGGRANLTVLYKTVHPVAYDGYCYIGLSPEDTLKLGSDVKRVDKDIYIMAVFGDLLRKYHERFKQNASMDLHEQLRYRAAAIVEDLW